MTARDGVLACVCLASLALAGGSSVSVAQAPTLLEPDFTVTTLPAGVGSTALACSPGGEWGDFVYVADSAAGRVERLDFDDVVSTFAGPFNFPVGLEFGPGPGNDFGALLYVGDFGSSQVRSVSVAGSISPFASFPGPGGLAFDPAGSYGTQLFASSVVGGSIRAIANDGSSSLFSGAPSDHLSFGPGGAWGAGLYSTDRSGRVSGPDCCFDHDSPGCADAGCQTSVCGAAPACCSDPWNQSCANLALDDGSCSCVGYGPGIVQVDPGGTPTSLADGFVLPQGFDWAEGPGWNDDMFVADLADGVVRRLSPGGTSTDFALIAGAADVAFCNCSLYVVGLDGRRFRISSDADDTDLDGSGDACDTCPGFFNPPGLPAVFGTILATSGTTFSWTTAADVRYVRGSLALVSSYGFDFVRTVAAATSFSDAMNPFLPGTGFYYLAQPFCADSSWQTSVGAEPDRDLVLP